MPARGSRAVRTPVGDASDPHSLEAHLGEFAEWMGIHGYAARTIADRVKRVGFLQIWLAERGVVRTGEVSKAMLDRYQRHLFYYRKPNGEPLTFLTQKGGLRSWAGRGE